MTTEKQQGLVHFDVDHMVVTCIYIKINIGLKMYINPKTFYYYFTTTGPYFPGPFSGVLHDCNKDFLLEYFTTVLESSTKII